MGEPLTGRTSDQRETKSFPLQEGNSGHRHQYNTPRMKRFYYDVVSYENDKYMCNLKRSSHLFMGSYFCNMEGFG